MRTVPAVKVVTAEDAVEEPLPARVQEALGQLVGAAKEGLLALSVGVGLGVLSELMEEEVDEVVGPKGKWNTERDAVRHGHEDGEVTLGGRRVAVERPRVRSADGEAEVPLCTYQHFADRDPLSRLVLEPGELALELLDARLELAYAAIHRQEHLDHGLASGVVDRLRLSALHA